MTPKLQQMRTYELVATNGADQMNGKFHRRSLSSTSDIFLDDEDTARFMAPLVLVLHGVYSRITRVVSPVVLLLFATPIIMRYPSIQLIIFLTFLIGSSPLYFIMINFSGTNSKLSQRSAASSADHKRKPSKVESISFVKSGETD